MYKLSQQPELMIIRLADGAHIPVAPGNRDYEEYKVWLAEGNSPEPADVTPADVQLRAMRDQLLAETDTPWGLADYDHPDKQLWYDYRQALRDLTTTADPQLDADGNLTNVTWPTKPVSR